MKLWKSHFTNTPRIFGDPFDILNKLNIYFARAAKKNSFKISHFRILPEILKDLNFNPYMQKRLSK